MIGLDDVARMYAVLTDEMERQSLGAQMTTFPRGARLIVNFLSGYCNHSYQVEKDDFYTEEGVTPELLALRPKEYDLYSACIIHERAASPNGVGQVRRLVQILLNTGKSHTTSDSVLNYCWGRFCLVKEACQSILYEEKDRLGNNYPVTITFEEVGTLFSRINNEPFSLWDFDDEDYGSELAIENAAELLATGLLFPFENALEVQKSITVDRGEVGLRTHNYMEIAEHCKVPRRYVEVIVTWKGLQGLVSDIGRARNGEL